MPFVRQQGLFLIHAEILACIEIDELFIWKAWDAYVPT